MEFVNVSKLSYEEYLDFEKIIKKEFNIPEEKNITWFNYVDFHKNFLNINDESIPFTFFKKDYCFYCSANNDSEAKRYIKNYFLENKIKEYNSLDFVKGDFSKCFLINNKFYKIIEDGA